MHTISKIDFVSSFSLRSVRFINLQKEPSQLLNDVSTKIIKFLLFNKSFYVVLALLPFKTSKHIAVNEKTYYNSNLIILLFFFLEKKPIEWCLRKKMFKSFALKMKLNRPKIRKYTQIWRVNECLRGFCQNPRQFTDLRIQKAMCDHKLKSLQTNKHTVKQWKTNKHHACILS